MKEKRNERTHSYRPTFKVPIYRRGPTPFVEFTKAQQMFFAVMLVLGSIYVIWGLFWRTA